MSIVRRTGHWSVFVRPDEERHVALRVHVELTPVVEVDDLTLLDPAAQADFWAVLRWIVQEYELTHYGIGVAQRGPLVVHVLAGDGTGSARFDLDTGAVSA